MKTRSVPDSDAPVCRDSLAPPGASALLRDYKTALLQLFTIYTWSELVRFSIFPYTGVDIILNQTMLTGS